MFKSLKLILPILISLLFNNERGWTHPQTGWEVINSQNMAFYFIQSAYLDNVELEDQQKDVIGVFFNQQCIGWSFYSSGLTGISTAGNDESLPNYPDNGDTITFKFYDYSNNEIIDAFTTQSPPLWEENQIFNMQYLHSCSSNYPPLNDGTCIIDCMGDPNLDGQINVLDIIEIINLIINCSDFSCYENYLECMDYNNDESINVLDAVLIIESILR